MRSVLVNVAKVLLSVALLVYLIRQIASEDPGTFRHLLDDPKRWPLMFGAWACFMAALGAGLLRWLRLARAVGLPCSPRTGVRIGILAYTVDFAAFGAAGGDLFKALSLRRLHGGRSVHALTTVVADRLVGMGVLLVCASAAVIAHRAWTLSGVLPALSRGILGLTAMACIAATLGLAMRDLAARGSRHAAQWRFGGAHVANVLDAAVLYARSPAPLAQAAALSLAVVAANVTGFCLLAHGLSPAAPSWSEHVLIVPLSSLTGIVPLPADTLGVLDYAMSYLYRTVPADAAPAALGVMVVMSYRIVGVALTAVGAALYLMGRHGEPDLARVVAGSRPPLREDQRGEKGKASHEAPGHRRTHPLEGPP